MGHTEKTQFNGADRAADIISSMLGIVDDDANTVSIRVNSEEIAEKATNLVNEMLGIARDEVEDLPGLTLKAKEGEISITGSNHDCLCEFLIKAPSALRNNARHINASMPALDMTDKEALKSVVEHCSGANISY